MAENTDVLTAEQLAGRYGVSTRTVADWRYKDTGPEFFTAAGKAIYAMADVLAWEKRRKQETDRKRKAA